MCCFVHRNSTEIYYLGYSTVYRWNIICCVLVLLCHVFLLFFCVTTQLRHRRANLTGVSTICAVLKASDTLMLTLGPPARRGFYFRSCGGAVGCVFIDLQSVCTWRALVNTYAAGHTIQRRKRNKIWRLQLVHTSNVATLKIWTGARSAWGALIILFSDFARLIISVRRLTICYERP